MPEVATLNFAAGTVTSSQMEVLVKNTGEALAKALMIEIKVPLYLVSREIVNAVAQAREQNLNDRTTTARVSLANVVTGPAGWSVWAATERTDSLAVIRLFNDLDQTGAKLAAPVKVETNAQLNLRVPLTPLDKPVRIEIPYLYRYPNEGRSAPQVEGKFEMTSSGAGTTSKVIFKVDHTSPTTIPAGRKVNISWEIENGVSAMLFGPLPGGNSQMSLSSNELETYKIKKGSLGIIAVGAAMYILQAEVEGAAKDKPHELIVKTVFIDVDSPTQYSYLSVRPAKVLPYGVIDVNWAVWDCKEAWLQVGEDNAIKLELTEQGPSQKYQGSGIWRVNAPQESGDVSAWLEVLQEVPPEKRETTDKKEERVRAQDARFHVAKWVPKPASAFTGQPIGMAFAVSKLALLTTGGLWISKIGAADPSDDPVFTRVAVDPQPKAWHAITSFEKGFAVVQQTNDDGLQLVRYTIDGTRDGLPVDLPGTLQLLVRAFKIVCDLAVLGERVYIVVEASAPGGPLRHAFSVSFRPSVQLRSEPLLEQQFPRYRLIAFDNALYAINRDSGRMFRFRHTTNGELDQPTKAASAVEDCESMIRRGLMVAVGRLLVVLGPSSSPPVEALEGFESLKCTFPKGPPRAKGVKQDLVYNPQQDHWIPCGHGLDVEEGTVVAFRPGASQRLWVVQRDGQIRSLINALEHLFAPEFESDFSAKKLPPALDASKKRKLTIKNDARIDFVPMSETYQMVGLTDFSSSGPAAEGRRLMPGGTKLGIMTSGDFELICNESDPVPMKLRFLAERKDGVPHDYMLEVSLSGPDLSITSVFKRLAVDAQGRVSIAEVPGTRQEHGAVNRIAIQPPRPLHDGITLNIRNQTAYRLMLQNPRYDRERFMFEDSVTGPKKINLTTPAFFVYAQGIGELHFDYDLALQPGIEVSPRSSPQTTQIRIDASKAGPLTLDSVSMKQPGTYECAVNYRVKEKLEAIYIGDGGATKDGNSIYLPVALPSNAAMVQVWKIDANTLSAMPSASFSGKGVFSTPNNVAVLEKEVGAIFGDTTLHILDQNFQTKKQTTVPEYTAITNFIGDNEESRMFFLGFKEEQTNQPLKYRYKYTYGYYQHDRLWASDDVFLDSQKGYREQNRVAGAPAWVSSSTVSPMFSYRHIDTFICIEGGIIQIHKLVNYSVEEIRLEGTGREEAIVFEPFRELIFCAHSTPDYQRLIISRVNKKNMQEKKSITLPGPVLSMAADTKPFKTPALQYKQHRAVSMALAGYNSFFVTHGRTIYHINNDDLSIRAGMNLDLPCRIIHVKGGRPAGVAEDCWMVWAIGAWYKGDGTNVAEYKTEIYKLMFRF